MWEGGWSTARGGAGGVVAYNPTMLSVEWLKYDFLFSPGGCNCYGLYGVVGIERRV